MKITKRQLKRIIAEEYALVHGTKRRRTSRRSTRNARQLREAKRAELLREAKAKILVEEMMQEGWFTDLIGGLTAVGGEAGKAAKAGYEKVAKATTDAWKATKQSFEDGVKANQEKEKQAAEKKALEFAEADAKSKYQEYMQGLVKIFLDGGYEDEEAQAKAGMLALAWGDASAPG
tara:strand:- start:12 stop:539 length:528 start_codon:yes stop_codon:yes gene_type:complete